jgi:integrase
VFPTRVGKVQSYSNIRKRGLIPLMKKAGLVDADGNAKYTGLHSLRHWYASWLINPASLGGREVAPMIMQYRLGHATLAMTTDVYGHLFPQEQVAGAESAAELQIVS